MQEAIKYTPVSMMLHIMKVAVNASPWANSSFVKKETQRYIDVMVPLCGFKV